MKNNVKNISNILNIKALNIIIIRNDNLKITRK